MAIFTVTGRPCDNKTMLELALTDREVLEQNELSFWSLPSSDIRMKELRPEDIIREDTLELADAGLCGKRHVLLTKEAIYYSTVNPTQSSTDRRIRRFADLTNAKADSFEELRDGKLIFGIRIAKGRSQSLELFFVRRLQLEEWMETLEHVCKFHHFKDQYRLLYKIGSGHFGTVYAAHHYSSGHLYAVKILPKTIRHIIDNEINILKSLSIPNTAQVVKVFEDSLQIYVVMNFAQGADLQNYLERHGAVEESVTQKVIYSLAETLGQIHSRGVIHRDLKPENVIVDISLNSHLRSVTLVDFGLSVRVDHVQVGTCSGTAGYIAPEQLRQETFGTKADMFSLGVIAYTMISGRNPFSSQDERKVAYLNSKCRLSFEEKEWKGVGADCIDFVKKLTSVNPGLRLSAESALQHPWLSCLRKSEWKPSKAKITSEASCESNASEDTAADISFSV